MDFNSRLKLVLENAGQPVSQDVGDKISKIRTMTVQIEQTKNTLLSLQQELSRLVEELNADLALVIRKHNPNLRVILHDGCCNVAYRKKNLNFRPNLESNSWNIDGTDPTFCRRFISLNKDACNLSPDVSELGRAAAGYFTNQYRTLQCGT